MALTELVNSILKYSFHSVAQIKILLLFYFNENNDREIEMSYDEIIKKTNLSKGIISNSIKYLVENNILSIIRKANAYTIGKYLINYSFSKKEKKNIKKFNYRDDCFYYRYILEEYYFEEINNYLKDNDIDIIEFFNSKEQIILLTKKFIITTISNMYLEKLTKIIQYIIIWCWNENDIINEKHINTLAYIMGKLIVIDNYDFDLIKDIFLFYEFRMIDNTEMTNILIKYKKLLENRPEYLQGNFRKKLKRFIRLNLE